MCTMLLSRQLGLGFTASYLGRCTNGIKSKHRQNSQPVVGKLVPGGALEFRTLSKKGGRLRPSHSIALGTLFSN